MDADPDGETSLNPAWRPALIHYGHTGALSGSPDMTVQEYSDAMRSATERIQPLRDITPGSGAYWNESDVNEPDWEYSFFGENYQALKEIKAKYDPWRTFRVWNGVGGTRPETGSAV